MTFDLTIEDGTYLVKLARRSIEAKFNGGEADISDAPEITRQVCGVFVTLSSVKGTGETLRGCIGYPTPIRPLVEAVREVAQAAAFEDPRFPELRRGELSITLIEVSVLTPPEIIKVVKPDQYPNMVRIGVDGLIVKKGFRSGLLLPQVAPEWGWDPEEFLSQCCIKAGLPQDSWLLKGTEISRFQAIIFTEIIPEGDVVRKALNH
ncbi:MAG: TIGR00296 family protein [Candidatus Bathyarchaeota archaeon]|nr:TIGR00296 family protein [Candidatus Bathyarchaeota archaeon]